MNVSVVISTYNGEKYIEEQLLSILNQTRTPDTVVIRDDCSTDNTVKIIQSFITDHSLNNWFIEINEKNQGWKKNFHDLILSSSEDIIFTCDQDDIWDKNKIDEMARIIENNTEIDLLACDYIPFYEDSTRKINNKIIKGMKSSSTVEKISFDEKFMNVLRPGCTFAIQKTFCQSIASEWDVNLPHDAMLWRTAVIKGTGYVYHKALITWRRYSNSSSTPKRSIRSAKNKYDMMFNFYIECNKSHLLYLDCIENLIRKGVIKVDERTSSLLSASRQFETNQMKALMSHNPVRVATTNYKYRAFLLSPKSILTQSVVSAVTCLG